MAQYEKAISDFGKTIALSELYKPYALNNRADAKRRLKKYEEALKDVNESIGLDSLNSWAYMNRGLIYADMGNLDTAMDNLNRSVEINSQLANPYFHRGNLHLQLKQYDKAITDYNKLQELDPAFKSKEVDKNKKAAKKGFLGE
jgi:tetratricopeptide (TPR) repeat protein